ncbi:MAG: alpha-glucosidase C-terminal domain-containing protein, partial [Acidimicrobiales bacterium]
LDIVSCANPSVFAYVRSPRAADDRARGAHDLAREPRRSDPSRFARRRTDRRASTASSRAATSTNSVLCVHNLSRFAQPAELDLARWVGSTPAELLGRVPFGQIAPGLYPVTLGPHGFYWFELLEENPAEVEAQTMGGLV